MYNKAFGSLYLKLFRCTHIIYKPYNPSETVGAPAIRVARVVVVDGANRVDIPSVVGVATVSGAQPNVDGAI